jgi:hypothetical protein
MTHAFGLFGMNSYHTNSENAREGDSVFVVSGDTSLSPPGVDYSLEGLFRISRRHSGPFSLYDKNGKRASFSYRFSMSPIRIPDEPIFLGKADWYDRDDIRRYFASGQNFNPLPTNPDYRQRFECLLAGYALSDAEMLLQDLADIELRVPSATEREILAMARIGQGKFRSDVVAAWGKGEICALTEVPVPEMLTASHIKPWRDSTDAERLDAANGLMLVAHADRLFDRYLLSFRNDRDDYFLELNPRIRGPVSQMGIRSGLKLNTSNLGFNVSHRFQRYMQGHYDLFLKRIEAEKTTL